MEMSQDLEFERRLKDMSDRDLGEFNARQLHETLRNCASCLAVVRKHSEEIVAINGKLESGSRLFNQQAEEIKAIRKAQMAQKINWPVLGTVSGSIAVGIIYAIDRIFRK